MTFAPNDMSASERLTATLPAHPEQHAPVRVNRPRPIRTTTWHATRAWAL